MAALWVAPVFAQTLDCGEAVDASIAVAGERHSYTLVGVASGDKITLRIGETSGTALDLIIRLRDANGDEIAWDGSEITTTLAGPEPYSVLAYDHGDDETGSYRLTFQRLSDGPCSAPALACGDAVEAAIRPRADIDSYELSGFGAGDTITLRMVQKSTGLFGEKLELFDGAGNLVARDEPLTVTLSTAGPYTLLASEVGDDSTDDYRLTAQRLNDPCNATTLSCGGYVRGAYDAIGDLDTYALDGVAQGDTVDVRTARTSPFPVVALYDGDGSLVASDVLSLTATLSGPPPYTLLTREQGNDETGDYSLSFQRTNGACFATELACGQTVSGNVSTGQASGLSLTGVAQAEAVELVAWQTGGLQPRLEVFDGQGALLGSGDSTGVLHLRLTLSSPGPYSALVSDRGNSGFGAYGVALRRPANACNAPTLTTGEKVQGDLAELVDMEELRIDSQVADATICLVPAAGSLDPCVDIFDGTGTTLHTCARNVYLPAAGGANLYVRDADFEQSGSYALQLLAGDADCTAQDLIPPSVEVTDPDGAQLVIAGESRTITWSSSDDGVINGHEVRLSIDGGTTYPTLIAAGVSGAARSYAWDVPADLATTAARIQVIAEDSAGNRTADESDAVFSVAALPQTSRTTYEYDLLDRLTKVTYSDGSTISYSYDALGNRTELVVVGSCSVGARQLDLHDLTITTSEVYEACEIISAGPAVTIEAGDVVLRAGETVVLGSGFSITGGSLRIEIDPSLVPP